MRTREIQNLRPEEVLAEKAHRSIVYLPLGPLEWHGPAMPLGTDPMAAQAAALAAAQVTGGVVMPTLYCGTERERPPEMLEAMGFEDTSQYLIGQDFPCNSMKSFYTKEDVFSLVVREYLRLLVEQGYKLIVLVNGHGAWGQQYQLKRLAVEFSNETASRVMIGIGLDRLDENDEDMGHATRTETAVQMALCEENVDLSRLPPKPQKLKNCEWGIDDACTFALHPNADKTVIWDPRDATAELGRRYLEKGTRKLIEMVREEWNALFPDQMI